jgi:ATP-dependent DNA helicase RecG
MFYSAPGFEEAVSQATPEVIPEVAKILPLCGAAKSKRELQLAVGIRDEKHFRESYIQTALEAGLLERTIPEKPQSSKQQYRLTTIGHRWLRQQGRT